MAEDGHILVTGATGLIGRAIVRLLLSQGHHVRALLRSKENMYSAEKDAEGKLSFWEADLCELSEDAARALCAETRAVVHCAGLVHQPNAEAKLYPRFNEIPTQILAKAAKAEKVEQFIFLSSSSVYGNRETNLVNEDEPCIADTPYASSKINCERLLLEETPCPSTIVMRPSMVFGEGDRGNMLSLIRQVLSGKYFLISHGSAQKSLIYAADFAHAVSLVLQKNAKGMHTYNVANPHPVSMQELSRAILAAAQKPENIPSVPGSILRPLGALANSVLGNKSPLSKDRLDKLTRTNSISIDRFCKDYGFSPNYELKQSLENEITWARGAKLL